MKVQKLTGIGKMEAIEVPEPKVIDPNDVLLKIAYVGVCGSDVHYYETGRIGSQTVQFPFIVGHECSATVIDFGSAVTNLDKGESVVIEPAISCWKCDQCLANRPHTCRNLKFLGCPGQIEGCLCEYLVMPSECCIPTKNKITPQQGVLCEPFAIGLYAVKQSRLVEQTDPDIAILGSGPIGLSCLTAAKAEEVANVYMTDRIGSRVKTAKKAGASWSGNPNKQDIVHDILQKRPFGMDVVFECAGQPDTLDQALELLKPGGKLVMVGIPREQRISFNPDLIRRKEINIINIRRQNHCTQKAIDMIARKMVDIDFMITHTLELAQTRQAFDLVAGYQDNVIKALIKVS